MGWDEEEMGKIPSSQPPLHSTPHSHSITLFYSLNISSPTHQIRSHCYPTFKMESWVGVWPPLHLTDFILFQVWGNPRRNCVVDMLSSKIYVLWYFGMQITFRIFISHSPLEYKYKKGKKGAWGSIPFHSIPILLLPGGRSIPVIKEDSYWKEKEE